MNVLQRNHVLIEGRGTRPLVFAHGYGCDQQMWRFVAPSFLDSHRVVLFDHVGCGRADLRAWSPDRHGQLGGYAQDVAEILDAADLRDAVLVGHSVSSMIVMLAALLRPERVAGLVMVCPSPRYLDDPPGYRGGFARGDIEGLLDMIEHNMIGWADFLAPTVMGADSTVELTEELKASFCALDPVIARRFAEVTFLGDNRADLPWVRHPTLILQVEHDAIAPPAVGRFVHEQVAGSELVQIEGAGHCPHMTHPEATRAALQGFLERLPSAGA